MDMKLWLISRLSRPRSKSVLRRADVFRDFLTLGRNDRFYAGSRGAGMQHSGWALRSTVTSISNAFFVTTTSDQHDANCVSSRRSVLTL